MPENDEGHIEYWVGRRSRKSRDVGQLTELLHEPIEGPFAAKYLAQIGARQTVGALEAFLESSNPRMRAAVAEALAGLGAAERGPRLLEAVSSESEAWVRARLLWSGGQLLDSVAIPQFVGALQDADWMVRRTAVAGLANWGTPAEIEALENAAANEGRGRRMIFRRAVRKINRRSR